ncbi:MAG: DUF4976 domain-containing protein [Verrucomicrobiae bacterium]|nr:DUF4976 domain-containing protein [Verrucomicrobiae bacterium]
MHFQYGDIGWELYDSEKDPDELNNICGLPRNRKLVSELKAELASLRSKYKEDSW